MDLIKRCLRGIEVVPISVVAFACATMLGNYVTHPGMHALLAMCILDIILLRRSTRWSAWSILILIILNVGATWAIAYQKYDGIEDWYATACLIITLILVLMPLTRYDESMKSGVGD